jgi:membrane protein required for beta-lactamase induction
LESCCICKGEVEADLPSTVISPTRKNAKNAKEHITLNKLFSKGVSVIEAAESVKLTFRKSTIAGL